MYETGVYGLLWADERLQQQDPERPFTWDLRVTWPLIDEPGDPSGPMGGRAERALADEVHARMTNWVAGLWMLSPDVHLESLGRCYVSARLTSSWYSDGAHPNEDFEVFNWLLPANRRLTQADLFRDDSDWRRGLLGLIESASAPLPTASVTMTWPPGSIMGTLRRPRGSR